MHGGYLGRALGAVLTPNLNRCKGGKTCLLWLLVAVCIGVLVVVSYIPSWHFVFPEGFFVWIHTLEEMLGVVIALAIAGLIWNISRQRPFSLEVTVGGAFLGAGLTGMLHILSSSGMPDFITVNTPAKAIYFWLANRLMISIGLILYALNGVLWRQRADLVTDYQRISIWRLLSYVMPMAFSVVVFITVIYFPDLLPPVYLEGAGLTPYKIGAEILYTLLLGLVWLLLLKDKNKTGERITNRYIRVGIAFSILTQVALTCYKNEYDTYVLLGHLFSILSNYCLFAGLFITMAQKPYQELAEKTNDLSRQAARMKILADVSQEFAQSDMNVEVISETIARTVSRLTGDACIIRLVSDDGTEAHPIAIFHPDGKTASEMREVFASYPMTMKGIVTDAMRSCQPILLEEPSLDQIRGSLKEEYWPNLQSYRDRVSSIMVLPLSVRGQVIGTMGVVREKSVTPHTTEDKVFLQALADQAAVAIENSRLYSAAQTQKQEIEALLETAKHIAHSDDLSFILNHVLDDIVRHFDADVAGVALLDPGGSRLTYRASRGVLADNLRGISLENGERLIKAMTRLGKVANIPDIVMYAGLIPLSYAKSVGIRSVLCVPLYSGERVIGILTAMSRKRSHFSPNSEQWMVGLADQTATAIERAREITERKSIENQFRQAQKMEAVGRLAGGIAHDFNNLLTVINGFSELLLLNMGDNDRLRSYAEEISKAGKRAESLTQQLLAFSRQQVMIPKILNLNTVVTGLEGMLRRLIGEDIELITDLAPALEPVQADPGQIEQVIMNLVVNARDAMPHGGKLVIDTSNISVDEVYAEKFPGLKPGDYVLLRVSDTGVGMDEETLSHIFEPFFTTKEAGKGTGLGLCTAYGIVKQSNGYIAVSSSPGWGASFDVYLPQARERSVTYEMSYPNLTFPGGCEKVLLVEDEDMVRNLASRVLRLNGYTVMEADCGEKALAMAKNYPETIDLLITDVIMPGINGRETADRLKEMYPAVKVIYISGYADKALHSSLTDPNITFIQKPFTPAVFAQKVREVLDSREKSLALHRN